MNILVADDHVLFRESLACTIKKMAPQAHITEACTADETLLKADDELDLILLDLSMPGRHAFPVIKQLRSTFPSVPVAIVSGSEDPGDIANALFLGACGFIPKTFHADEIIAALTIIMDGNHFIPERFKAQVDALMLPQSGKCGVESGVDLTNSQLGVLTYMAEGISNKEIAKNLGITEGTVKLHVSSILRSLGAPNRTKAVLRAVKLGLIQPIL